jgi:3-hydroxyisobutyrate dehydrogenase-like beta-hydroxyacid dehydrogenase
VTKHDAPPPVTVIGLGPMGRAMTRALLARGHQVTVWNRTARRADELVALGATKATTPADAVGAVDLVILSLTDYRAMYDVFGAGSNGRAAVDRLAGKVIVNLSSDTPARTREAAAWAAGHGARFLTGGVMVPAPMVGTDNAYVYCSGPRDVFDTCELTLRAIGEPRYLGADAGLAQLFYQAQLDVFLTTLSGLLHAAALVAAAGVPAAEFLPQAIETISGIPAMIGDGTETARQLDTGVHPGDLSTTTMMGATAGHILDASADAGIDLHLPRAIRTHYDRAIAAGHGNDNWTSLYEVIRAGAAPHTAQ